jgi:prepilin-type N-terminal cleavage/methylation domain-containing protein
MLTPGLAARPQSLPRPSRRGLTLIELVVVLTIGGAVIAMVGGLAARSQRFHRELARAGDRLDQVDQTTVLLASGLRGLAPGEGDIAAGEARDTSIQLRATIGTAVVCDTAGGLMTLAPAGAVPMLASYADAPVVGDTVWIHGVSWPPVWLARGILTIATDAGGCLIGGVEAVDRPGRRLVLTLTDTLPAGTAPGAPLRVTRPLRYSLYRAADRSWYLGAREWNAAAGRFNAIQPVSGPFLPAIDGGIRFTYRDTSGAVVPAGAADPRGIALIEIGIRSDSGDGGRPGPAPAFGTGGEHRTLSAALRNRASRR